MSVFVRARPCFWNGVFCGPKNGMTKTNKPPAKPEVLILFASFVGRHLSFSCGARESLRQCEMMSMIIVAKTNS